MELLQQLEQYQPFNEQESIDKEVMLDSLRHGENVFSRDNLVAHMTASAWVVNQDHSLVLMAYHNIYHAWAWLGGHADGEEDLLKVALKEVEEESGLKDVKPVNDSIFSIEILTVDGHQKNGKYVPSHLHMNVTYLLEASDQEVLHHKEDENQAVAWFQKEEAIQKSSEKWMRENIYTKLNQKLEQK